MVWEQDTHVTFMVGDLKKIDMETLKVLLYKTQLFQ